MAGFFAASASRRVLSEANDRLESASSWLSRRGHLWAPGNYEIEAVISRLGGCFFQSSEYASTDLIFPPKLDANDAPVFAPLALYSNHKKEQWQKPTRNRAANCGLRFKEVWGLLVLERTTAILRYA
ncbi:hypothetical protein [Paraburkholderia graminis]